MANPVLNAVRMWNVTTPNSMANIHGGTLTDQLLPTAILLKTAEAPSGIRITW